MNKEKLKEITLRIFFPAMYLCAASVLVAIWGEDYISDSYFRLIPTFFIIGLASWITWAMTIILELLQIFVAKAPK